MKEVDIETELQKEELIDVVPKIDLCTAHT